MDNQICWIPPSNPAHPALLSRFIREVNLKYGISLTGYEELHAWSVENLSEFWDTCWTFLDVSGDMGALPHAEALDDMVNALFFPRGVLNFAENCLRRRDDGPAIIFTRENIENRTVSWRELYELVSAVAAQLRADGVAKGDRVCAVAANVPETVVCMLATASIGAIWSSVSPDFGVEGILERFAQIQPCVFFHTDSYHNKDRLYDVSSRMKEVESELQKLLPPTSAVKTLISVSLSPEGLASYCQSTSPPTILFERTNFNDPMFIMFSSGTTGKPKCIVHRHGILLQLMKEHQLHSDIRRDDRVFFYTTTTWMMWNWLTAALASEAAIMLYEGNPFFPTSNTLFEFASREECTFFGVSPKFIDSLKSAPDFAPLPLIPKVRAIAATGSVLVPESYDFVYDKIVGPSNSVMLCGVSGGTDILSCFMLGCPIKPVKRGFLQCRGLGLDVQVWDPDTAKPLVGEKGELVCCKPFPSQPIGFWGDSPTEKTKYREAYFADFPNVWKHGDYCLIDSEGHVCMFGRSDATLKPGGVRIGTAEIYRAVERMEFVKEAICCGIELKPGEESVALFVVLTDGLLLTNELRDKVRKAVASSATRHHVPAVIEQVSDIPRTKSGKIVELAVKNVLNHKPIKNLNALANPEALKEFEQFAPPSH